MRRLPIWIALTLVLLSMLALPATGALARTERSKLRSELADPASAWAMALQPESAVADLAHFADAPRYRLDLEYAPSSWNLSGHEEILFTNRGRRPLHAVYLRTQALVWGDPLVDEAVRFTMENLRVDGRPAAFTMGKTLIRVPLSVPLVPGSSVTLAFDFRARLPAAKPWLHDTMDFSHSHGTYGYSLSATGLDGAIPWLLPGGDQGSEYDLLPSTGFTYNPEPALFDLRLRMPAAWQVISSGVTVAEEAGAGGQVSRVVAAGMGLNLFISGQLQEASREVGGVRLSAYYLAQMGEIGPAILAEAEQALTLYQRTLGPYPDRELEILPIYFGYGIAGMNPGGGLILLNAAYYTDVTYFAPATITDPELKRLQSGKVTDPRREILFHEIAHTWWGHLTTNDRFQAPWWIEGLANATALAAVEQTYGAEAAGGVRDRLILGYKNRRAAGMADLAIGRPNPDAGNIREYLIMSYVKPALFYDQVRREVGDEAFFAGLRRYVAKHRRTATFDRGPIEELLGRERVDDLYRRWMVEAHGDEDIGLFTAEQMRQLGLVK